MSSETAKHSREDIWSRVDSQSDAIAEIRAGQSATDARLGALESAVSDGFRSLATEIHGLAERVNAPKPQPNAIAIMLTGILGFVTVLAMFGSFASLVASPIQKQVDSLKHDVERLEEFDREANYIHGQRYALEQRVDDIDQHGSRRWVDRDE